MSPSSASHGPMTLEAFQSIAEWVRMRLDGRDPRPDVLAGHLPQGVISSIERYDGASGADDGTIMCLTLQTVRSQRLHIVDREGDNSASRPRRRYFEPEAIAVIRLALANGGTLFVDDNAENKDESGEGKWHYPEFYGMGLTTNRVFMAAGPGDRVRQYTGHGNELGYRDCRRRWLYEEPGGSPRATRGVGEFFETAKQTFAKPNPVDKITGPDHFEISPDDYVRLLVDALLAHTTFNPHATPQQVALWRRGKTLV